LGSFLKRIFVAPGGGRRMPASVHTLSRRSTPFIECNLFCVLAHAKRRGKTTLSSPSINKTRPAEADRARLSG
jgi:hypothetical protein